MPGALSLEKGEYYAHPRNRFWKVVDRVLRVPSSSRYDQRIGAVAEAGVALWDVLRHCTRVGSLDRDIDPHSEVPNEIVPFLRSNPTIRRIVFNGRKAERSLAAARWHS
jgi:hypoxanthine-DNA glycosylase